MKKFILKHWKLVVLCCIALRVLIWIGPDIYNQFAVDEYQDYGLGFFADVSAGYSRVRAPKRTYSSDEVIRLKVSTGFANTPEEAEKIKKLWLGIRENPVFDYYVKVGKPLDRDVTAEELEKLLPKGGLTVEVPCDEIKAEDLVYNGLDSTSIRYKSFDFHFYIYLVVREDAPEHWTRYMEICGDAYGEPDQYGNVWIEGFRVDYLQFKKNGDTITIE